jgi:hypothetical protein
MSVLPTFVISAPADDGPYKDPFMIADASAITPFGVAEKNCTIPTIQSEEKRKISLK